MEESIFNILAGLLIVGIIVFAIYMSNKEGRR